MIYNLSEKIAFYFVKKGFATFDEADVYRFGIETIICGDDVYGYVCGNKCKK